MKKIGYFHMASIEEFRPEYYELDIEEAIKIGKQKTEQVIGKYFSIE